MKYYSTNKQAPLATLEEAVVKGLAGDKGLYMPERIVRLDEGTINNMKNQSFHEIACTVAQAFFGEDIETVCSLSQGKSQSYPGMPVHNTGTEYHRP